MDSRFDLTKRTGQTETAEPMDQAAILVPESEWTVIPRGTRVQYKRRDGTFRSGGYILEQWLEAKPPHQGIYHAKLVLGHYTWVIRHPDIAMVWRVPGPPFGRRPKNVESDGGGGAMTRSPKESNNIQQRIAALEVELQELKRLVNGGTGGSSVPS